MKAAGQKEFVPTDEQRAAIDHVYGPMLVVAGAGTGKTTVLTRRIARLIDCKAAQSNEILAVTYTRNAAQELAERVGGLLSTSDPKEVSKKGAGGLEATTFHAYCRDLLRQAGIQFELVDDKDLFVMLRQRLPELRLQHYTKAADPGKFLRDLTEFFRRCHDELRTPDDYDAYVARLERKEIPVPRVVKSKDAAAMPDDDVVGRCHEIARVYRYTEELLKREGLGTFGHLITRAVALLSTDAQALARARKRARFLLIDEFQDSNVAQIRLAKLLGGDEANVFAVGDPDQAVYRFRGASSGTFDQFLETFGPARVKRVTMAKNRRSTPAILRCAYEAIRENPQISSVVLEDGPWERQPLNCGRLDDEPELTKAAVVQAIVHNSHEQEAWFIAETIAAARERQPQLTLSDFAVLYRGHKSRERVVAELRRRGVPFAVKGVDLFEAREVRDALAALRLMASSDAISLFRFAALPQFEIAGVKFRAAMAAAPTGSAMETVLERVPGGLAVVEAIREARRDVGSANGSLAAAIKLLEARLGLRDSLPGRRLQELAEAWLKKPNVIVGNGTLREFLEYLNLFREADGVLAEGGLEPDPVGDLWPEEPADGPARDAVQLMTIHAAKGLEFPCVFLVRVVSSSCPSAYREPLVEFPVELRDSKHEGKGVPRDLHAEEERRLFYVAMTRAKDRLYLCGKRHPRGKEPAPSKYLRELANLADTNLKGAIAVEFLPQREHVGDIFAAAEPEAADKLTRWVQLPPRPDARLSELSASAIEQYERCPLAFKLDRDWHIPAEPAASLQFGGAMHLALKAYFDGIAVGRPPSEDDVIRCFLDEFGKAKIEEELQRQMYEKDGREQLARFLRSELAKPLGTISQTERWFRVEIGGAVVKGSMDRIDLLPGNEVAIIDYKTGNPRDQRAADDSLQLSIYALAARRMGKEPTKLVFINLQNTSAVTTKRSADADANAESKVIEVAEKIAAGEFDPKPNFFCEQCGYYSICPAQEVTIGGAADWGKD